MSESLHFAEHTLQEVALVFMALVYTTRVIWLTRFTASKERQPETGLPDTSSRKGILYSWLNVSMPWAMESSRTKPLLYGSFIVFHLGVTAAIALSFIIPYTPGVLEMPFLIPLLQGILGAAFVVGVLRIIRRVGNKHMRAISSPDDYFSILLLTVWLFFSTLAASNSTANGEGVLLTFFILTAFFLVYVPFSKISHYLYYPFSRYYIGKTLGYRGSYPLRRGPAPRRTATTA